MQKNKISDNAMFHGVDHEKRNETNTNARLIAYGEKMGMVKQTGTAQADKGGKN